MKTRPLSLFKWTLHKGHERTSQLNVNTAPTFHTPTPGRVFSASLVGQASQDEGVHTISITAHPSMSNDFLHHVLTQSRNYPLKSIFLGFSSAAILFCIVKISLTKFGTGLHLIHSTFSH